MSINDRITSISTHLTDAYAEVSSKNGTVPSDKNLSNLAAAIRSIPTGGSPVVGEVQLNPPSLSLGTSTTTSDPLKITNSYNGNFVDYYDIYDGTTLLDTISANFSSNTINLRDYISSGTTHTIKVVAKGDGFLDSNAATVTYNYSTYATVTNNLTNCTTNNSATTVTIGSSYQAKLTADNGYSFVGATVSVVMNNVDVTSTVYNAGIINIASITGDIVITATFAVITQLGTPTISLDGTGVLTISAVTNATGYDIYLNGGKWRNVTTTSFQIIDELVLQGTYVITAKAVANGYLDSNASNSITYVNSSGTTPDPILENNDWMTIRLVCETGQANTYWSVGDTKTDLGTDGNTRTFRIVDMQGLYNKHVVFEQVEADCTGTEDEWKWDRNTTHYYRESNMVSTVLPAILQRYSSVLQNSLTPTSIRANAGPRQTSEDSLVYVEGKLFLASINEYSGYQPTSGAENYLTRYQYYSGTFEASRMLKHFTPGTTTYQGTASYWTRTKRTYYESASSNPIDYVDNIGRFGSHSSNYYMGVAPCFAF